MWSNGALWLLPVFGLLPPNADHLKTSVVQTSTGSDCGLMGEIFKEKYAVTILKSRIEILVILFWFIFTLGGAIARRIDDSNQLIQNLFWSKRMSSGLLVIIILVLYAGSVSMAKTGIELADFVLTVLVLLFFGGGASLHSLGLLLVLALPIQAVCPHCAGNQEGCTFATDGECPAAGEIVMNAAVIGGLATAGGKLLSLKKAILPRFFRAVGSAALVKYQCATDNIICICGCPPGLP